MTYSLNTLNADQAQPSPSVVSRFAQEIVLVLGAALLAFALLALGSHSMADPAWSTTGTRAEVGNWGGRLGAWLADVTYFLFGFSAWWAVLAGLRSWLSALARWIRGQQGVAGPLQEPASAWQRPWVRRTVFWLGLVVLMSASAVLEWTRLYRFDEMLPGNAGGALGHWLGPLVMGWTGFTGSALLMMALLVLCMPAVFRFSWGQMAELMGGWLDGWFEARRERREAVEDLRIGEQAAREREEVVKVERVEIEEQHPTPVHIEPALAEVPRSERVAKERQKPLFTELPDSRLPQVDLLDSAPAHQAGVDSQTLEMTSRLIEKKLKDFGVEVRVVAAAPGPVITRYEIEPATGVKGSQIVNLGRDLARSLSLVSIRVIETIPGKSLMALELPNAKRQTIKLSEILGSQVYNDARSLLTMGLGKDIAGQPVVADLAKMPHCLVAGTTGSGKSVGINAMILSLLYKADAKDVRLLLIDPKMLELSVYEGIPHLLAPVVTDMKHAANGLNWCVGEMERRYKLMSKMGVRNLAGFNAKIDEATARGEIIGNPFSLTPEQPEPLERLPHIVVVIDELADLMMVVGKKIEELIARLAQKARAAGIHLILATQRPSVDVITGLIKANIPTRLSFQVSSKIDSRTILDQMGAETLLGMGDMLYLPAGTGFPVRVHGAFVSDDEVHRVVAYLKEQGGEPNYVDGVLDAAGGDGEGADLSGDGAGAGGEKDPLYDQAVAIVLQDRKASISYVQRKLKIGYNRAARLLEDMEKAGLVSALTSSGQRDILVAPRGDA
ncbi:MAG: DNA translocase FtsK [Burkholderiales bacterium]|nr:MAG: DNA translocase FtsK [Burkholderiales bacterium]